MGLPAASDFVCKCAFEELRVDPDFAGGSAPFAVFNLVMLEGEEAGPSEVLFLKEEKTLETAQFLGVLNNNGSFEDTIGEEGSALGGLEFSGSNVRVLLPHRIINLSVKMLNCRPRR